MKLGFFFICISGFLCSGCGSFIGHAYAPPVSAYIGVQMDAKMIGESHPYFIVDVPFSFVADTVFLPYDLWPPAQHREPLKGWTFYPPAERQTKYSLHSTNQLDPTVISDYERYIRDKGLSTLCFTSGFYENSDGKRAVQFEATTQTSSDSWIYVLIYSKENKRIKVIKCNRSRHSC